MSGIKERDTTVAGVFKERDRIRVDSAGVIVLGAVFLFLSIGLVMMGGSVYRSIMDKSDESDMTRTTFAYIANQTRRADSNGGVQVARYHDKDALLLSQVYGDYTFITHLYYYEGALRELFVEEGTELDLEAGLPIVWLEDISFKQNDRGLITVTAMFEGGRKEEMFLATNSAPRRGFR